MYGLEQFLADLEEQEKKALERWGRVATSMERQMVEAAFDWINDNIQIKDGVTTLDPDLAAKLTELQNTIVSIATGSKTYQNGLTSFISTIKDIQKNMNILNDNINFTNIRDVVKGIQNIVIEETVNAYTENGLNANFAAPLRENIYNNALAGQNMKQIRANLVDYIVAGKDKSGKLYSYLTQTAQQAVDSFTAATNMKIQQEFDSVGMFISGSLIETSSKQCVHAVEWSKPMGGFLTNAQWRVILHEARENKKASLIEGTTLANLDLNKLHWGCRHRFTPSLVIPKPI